MIHNTYLLDINIHHLQLSNECHGILSIGIGTLANVNISIDRNSSSYGIVVNFNYPNDLLVNGKPILDSVDVRFIDINNSELNCRGSEKNFPLLDDWNEVGKLVPLITSIPNLNPIGYLRPVIHLIRNKHLIVGQIQVVAQLYEYTTSTVEDVYCLADEKK